MHIIRGVFSADVDRVQVAGRPQTEYQVIVSRYGTPLYAQLEQDFEEALRVAEAYIAWEFDNRTDT